MTLRLGSDGSVRIRAGGNGGSGGSGPADLARSMLIDAIGPAASVCGECAGSRRVCWEREIDGFRPARAGDPDDETWGCSACEDGVSWETVGSLYQPFKDRFIAPLPRSWRLRRDDVLEWHSEALRARADAPA